MASAATVRSAHPLAGPTIVSRSISSPAGLCRLRGNPETRGRARRGKGRPDRSGSREDARLKLLCEARGGPTGTAPDRPRARAAPAGAFLPPSTRGRGAPRGTAGPAVFGVVPLRRPRNAHELALRRVGGESQRRVAVAGHVDEADVGRRHRDSKRVSPPRRHPCARTRDTSAPRDAEACSPWVAASLHFRHVERSQRMVLRKAMLERLNQAGWEGIDPVMNTARPPAGRGLRRQRLGGKARPEAVTVAGHGHESCDPRRLHRVVVWPRSVWALPVRLPEAREGPARPLLRHALRQVLRIGAPVERTE